MRRRLDARPPPPVDASVSVVVITRDGGPDLDQLLVSLADAVEGLEGEVVVVDNGGGEVARRLEGWTGPGRRVALMDAPDSFSAANNRGAALARGDVLCFLNDDVVPITRHWLRDMVDTVSSPAVAVAGAQLLYAPQPAMRRRFADLSVQHAGIRMRWRGAQVPRPVNVTHAAPVDPSEPELVGAVTAACLVVRRADFVEEGGFDEGYEFGAEDVDLCLRLRARGDIVVCHQAVLLHHEGATRRSSDVDAARRRQERNWLRFESVHGPALWHAVARDRATAGGALAEGGLRVAITVTRADASLVYGDLVTARRLGDELVALGHEVVYVERYRDAWYELPDDLDVVIVLLDTFDVRRVVRPGLTVVAWIRNWEARWAAHPWAHLYDLVLTSGDPGAVGAAFAVATDRVVPMPLAPSSVVDDPPGPEARSGVVTTVNHWGDDRGLPGILAAVPALEVYGKDWDDVPGVRANWRGPVSPDRVGELYRRAAVVVDLASPHTEGGGSVNARVFDALANGAVVVTNQPGVQRLFGEDVPCFADPKELAAILAAHDEDPGPLVSAAGRAREAVLREHTWSRRAEQLQDELLRLAERRHVALLTGAPAGDEGDTWGDTHLAEAFAAALKRRGMHASVVPRPAWNASSTRAADVTIHLKGRGRAPVAPGQLNLLWVISHPEEVADEELGAVDLVLAGSGRLAEHLRLRTSTPVHVLRQATDIERFRPGPVVDGHRTPVVFVGNSRFVERPMVQAAVAGGLDVVVHGGNWDRFLPRHVLGRTWIPNHEVADVYRSADVVLNDHWEIMRTWGLVSNRIFDALACGACVVTDRVDELEELFPDALAIVDGPSQVHQVVTELLADSSRRREMGRRGHELVVAHHTFDHRAAEFEHLLSEVVGTVREKTA